MGYKDLEELGDLPAIKWLYNSGLSNEIFDAIPLAAFRGQREYVEWMLTMEDQPYPLDDLVRLSIRGAMYGSKWHILQTLIDFYPDIVKSQII